MWFLSPFLVQLYPWPSSLLSLVLCLNKGGYPQSQPPSLQDKPTSRGLTQGSQGFSTQTCAPSSVCWRCYGAAAHQPTSQAAEATGQLSLKPLLFCLANPSMAGSILSIMWFGIHGSIWAGANSSLNQGTGEKREVERHFQDGAKRLGNKSDRRWEEHGFGKRLMGLGAVARSSRTPGEIGQKSFKRKR